MTPGWNDRSAGTLSPPPHFPTSAHAGALARATYWQTPIWMFAIVAVGPRLVQVVLPVQPPAPLTPTLQSLRQTWGVPCTVEWEGFAAAAGETPATGLETEVETHLFRIAQEAMNNAIRHGAPGRIRLQLVRTRRELTLSIADDGAGLPQPPVEGKTMVAKGSWTSPLTMIWRSIKSRSLQ